MKRFLIGLCLIAASGCSIDSLREFENKEDVTGPALVAQKQAFDGGCLTYVFEGKPLADVMAAMPNAKSIPVKESGSPTATAAWRVGDRNSVIVMQLPNGVACSASVMYGDPQRLSDAAVDMIQARGAFTKGKVDPSERGDAERTAWCTAGPYPYVVPIYRRTTGTRVAFLANVFKAQGAALSSCRPGS